MKKRFDGLYKALLVPAGIFFATALSAQEESDDLMMMEEVEQAPVLYTNEIEIGAGYVSDDSFKFGEYNGHQDKGGFAIANIKLRKFTPLDSSDRTYWELDGRNLGLDSRSVYGEYSQGHLFRLMFEYDQIPHNRFDDGRTPFLGAGTASQTLPAGWVGASNTGGLTALLSSLNRFDVETERQRYGAGAVWHITDRWQLSGNYQHETKDGSDTIGAVFGSNGGNPRSSILIRPIDYETDEFNVAVGYTGDKGQYSLSYHLSLFNNNDNALLWDNPFNLSLPYVPPGNIWGAGASFNDGARGRMGSEPDNEAYQITFAGGYNFGMRTRVTGNFSYGKMTQDQTFLPYSSVFPTVIPLPRNNLDGEIETIYANINVSTRLTNKLAVTARYTYDEKNNNTPTDIYVRIPGDASAQGGLISSNARVNWPYNLTRHKIDLEGTYNLLRTTRLTIGYNYESKDRDFTEFDSTTEHTGMVRLSASPFDFASGWIRYQHSIRNGSDYISNQPLLTGHNPAYIADITVNSPDDLYENDPLIRKFHIAERDRDQVAATANFYPSDVVTFTVSGKYNSDNFKKTLVGLQDRSNGSVSLDAGYTPNKKVSFHAYLTYENYDYKQRGFSHSGGALSLTPATNRLAVFGDNFWNIESEDNTYMGGAGVDWNVIEDKFTVKVDFLASHTVTEVTPTSTGLAFLPLPDLKTDVYQISAKGEYKYKENMGVRFRYLFETYDTSDFARDLVVPDTLGNVILLGNGTPNYSDHVVGVSWFYNWQ